MSGYDCSLCIYDPENNIYGYCSENPDKYPHNCMVEEITMSLFKNNLSLSYDCSECDYDPENNIYGYCSENPDKYPHNCGLEDLTDKTLLHIDDTEGIIYGNCTQCGYYINTDYPTNCPNCGFNYDFGCNNYYKYYNDDDDDINYNDHNNIDNFNDIDDLEATF
jgi:hypothetical protein